MAKNSPYLQTLEKLKKAYAELLKANNMKKIAASSEDVVRARTRRGYGVKKNEEKKEKLAKLKPSYVTKREKMSNLSEKTTPGKSNLTLSGKMLDSLESRAEKYGFKIYPGNTRAEKLTEYAEDGSANREPRPYMHLSDKEILKIKQEIDRTLRAILKTI